MTYWNEAITCFRKTEEKGGKEMSCVEKVASKHTQYAIITNRERLNPSEQETIYSEGV